MMLDLSEIVIRQGMRVELRVDQPSVEDPDLVFKEPIHGSLVFDNSGELINIHGQLDTSVVASCSRCLAEVEVPVKLMVEEHLPIDDVMHPDRPPSAENDYDTVVSSIIHLEQGRPTLDLDELIRQLIVAELPIQILCKEECAGLCPTCGVDRNSESCNCEDQSLNTPLAGLKALLEQE